jgi:2-polyprenyl-3-methyl-5-hydroxy-6-metoxy-1,4-benzoquinol methylase
MKVVFNKRYNPRKNNLFINKENIIFIRKFGFFYKVIKILYIQINKLLFKRKSQQILNILKNIEKKIFFLEKKIEQSNIDLTLDKNILKNAMTKNYEVITDFPVALQSPDHLHPTGTAVDNTRSPFFVTVINNFFSKKIDYLDLGCAGGGLCYDFLSKGNHSIGLEGSDYSKVLGRAFWPILPNNLYTADITKEFKIINNNDQAKFDLITAFEFLEHIKENDLQTVFTNVQKHLKPDGYFIGSIGTNVSFSPDGYSLHQTVWSAETWCEYLAKYFDLCEDISFEFSQFPRGVGNTYEDPNFFLSDIGFHFQCKNKKK